MPLPNAVDPWGVIHPVCPSMMLMGNRGILHKQIGVLVTTEEENARQVGEAAKQLWQHKSWVACDPRYKADDPNWKKRSKRLPGDKLQLMATLNDYSELFFLDDATALAAGHRPCGMCRRKQYEDFVKYWRIAHGLPEGEHVSAPVMDAAIHADRAVPRLRLKKTYEACVNALPHGAMFEWNGCAYLGWDSGLLLWTDKGYIQPSGEPQQSELVSVLTPACVVEVLRAGYVPEDRFSLSTPS